MANVPIIILVRNTSILISFQSGAKAFEHLNIDVPEESFEEQVFEN